MSENLSERQELEVGGLRQTMQEEYSEVAANRQNGFRFHT